MLCYSLLFLFNYTMALLGVFPHIFLSHPSDFLKYYMHSDDVVVELQHIMFYTIIAFSFLEYVSNSFPIIIPVNSLFHVKMQGGFIMPASTWIRSHYNVVLAYLHLLVSDHTPASTHIKSPYTMWVLPYLHPLTSKVITVRFYIQGVS